MALDLLDRVLKAGARKTTFNESWYKNNWKQSNGNVFLLLFLIQRCETSAWLNNVCFWLFFFLSITLMYSIFSPWADLQKRMHRVSSGQSCEPIHFTFTALVRHRASYSAIFCRDKFPDHWHEDGEMRRWMGRVKEKLDQPYSKYILLYILFYCQTSMKVMMSLRCLYDDDLYHYYVLQTHSWATLLGTPSVLPQG